MYPYISHKTWYMYVVLTLSVLCPWISRRILFWQVMLLCIIICYYWKIFSGCTWYSTTTVTKILVFLASIWMKWIRSLGVLYSDNIVDGHYIFNVNEITSVVVHNNYWWSWLLPVNINFVPFFFPRDQCVRSSINIQE